MVNWTIAIRIMANVRIVGRAVPAIVAVAVAANIPIVIHAITYVGYGKTRFRSTQSEYTRMQVRSTLVGVPRWARYIGLAQGFQRNAAYRWTLHGFGDRMRVSKIVGRMQQLKQLRS